ncbi:hypothetical protein KR032_010399 [Drosophila birchii]|nr:hypothetical protein KR032_010399 [Drosophila birchii]
MQRSTPFMVGPMVRGQLLGLAGNWRDIRRCMASSPWDDSQGGRRGARGPAAGAAESGSVRSDTSTNSSSSFSKGQPVRASATSMVMSDSSYNARGANQGALERRINREDNMWHNRNQIDTTWLNPRDPQAYKPNFRQTEPIVMRKQFMRSPDEVSREVLGRDWEEAVKAYRRSALTNMPDEGRLTGWEQQNSKMQLLHPSHQQEQQQQQHSQQPQQQQQQEHQHQHQHQHQQLQHQQRQHQQQHQQQQKQQHKYYQHRSVKSSEDE